MQSLTRDSSDEEEAKDQPQKVQASKERDAEKSVGAEQEKETAGRQGEQDDSQQKALHAAEAELQRVTAEKARLCGENDMLRTELNVATAKAEGLAAAKSAEAAVRQKEGMMQASINELSSKTKELSEENLHLKTQLKRISGGTDASELESLDELKKGKTNAEAKEKELQVRLDRMAVHVASVEAELDALLKRNEKLTSENQAYLQESVDQGNASKEITQERDRLKEKLAILETKCESLQSSNAAAKDFGKKLQAQVDLLDAESTATTAKLREEKKQLELDLTTANRKCDDLHARLKQSLADLELREDAKVEELEALRDTAAALQEKWQLAEGSLRSTNLIVDEKVKVAKQLSDEKSELIAKLEAADAGRQRAEAAARSEISVLTTARNVAEAEVVKLKMQLNSLHPMLKTDGDQGSLSLASVVEIQEELALTKDRLQQVQQSYKEVLSKREADEKAIIVEKRRCEHLASQLLESRFENSKLISERDNAVAWKETNEQAVHRATEALKTNEILAMQLQYVLHGAMSEAVDGHLMSSEAKLVVEFKDVTELQQSNQKLATQLALSDESHQAEIVSLRKSLEKQFGAELTKVEAGVQALRDEKAEQAKQLAAATEKCRRLAESLEVCSKYKGTLELTSTPQSAQREGKRKRENYELVEHRWGAHDDMPTDSKHVKERQSLSDELASANDEIDRLKYEALSLQRSVDTVEASRQHIQSQHEAALSDIKHMTLERDHYKQQAQLSDKGADEMLSLLLKAQNEQKELKLKVATYETQIQSLKEEVDRLRLANENMTQSSNRLDDMLTQVNSVQSFISQHKTTVESELKLQRDEARQLLCKKEEELQAVTNKLHSQKNMHDAELTELSAQLMSANEKLAGVSKMLEREKEQNKQLRVRSQKLAADLDTAETERKLLKQQTDNVDATTDYLAPDTSDTFKSVQRDLEAERVKHSTAQKTIESLKQAMKNLEDFSREAQERLRANDTEITSLRKQLDEAKRLEVTRQTEWKEKSAALSSRESVVAQAEASQKAHLEAVESNNKQLQKELDDGEKGRMDATERCEAAERDAQKMKERYESAVIANGELSKQIQDLKVEVKGLQDEIDTRNQQVSPDPVQMRVGLSFSPGKGRLVPGVESELMSQISSLQTELDKMHDVLAALEPAKEIQDSDTIAVIDAMRSRNKELQQRLHLESSELRITKAQIEQLRRQALVAAKQHNHMELVEKLERRIQNLKEDIKEREDKETSLRTELETTVVQLNEWKAAGTDTTALKNKLRAQSAQLQQMEAKLKFQTQQYEQMKASLSKSQASLAAKDADLSTLKKQMSDMEAQLKAHDGREIEYQNKLKTQRNLAQQWKTYHDNIQKEKVSVSTELEAAKKSLGDFQQRADKATADLEKEQAAHLSLQASTAATVTGVKRTISAVETTDVAFQKQRKMVLTEPGTPPDELTHPIDETANLEMSSPLPTSGMESPIPPNPFSSAGDKTEVSNPFRRRW